MITVLDISTGDLSIFADLKMENSIIDFRNVSKITIEDNGQEFILYAVTIYFGTIEIDRFKDKYLLAKKLSNITIKLNQSRINYEYTKEFVDWLRTAKNY